MIACICPGCGSKLEAKNRLAGRTVKCPKCGGPVEIPALPSAAPSPTAPADASPPPAVHDIDAGSLPPLQRPARLDRQNHYAICDSARVAAVWENNGKGWMLKTDAGLASAARNPEQLPQEGNFKLIELKLKAGADGRHLVGIVVFQLAQRWAMTNLDRNDDRILTAVTGHASLNRPQKDAVRKLIHEQFMREVWEKSHAVMDYLNNADYHSPGAGE